MNQETDEDTGRIVGVQIKAGPSYFRAESEQGWTVGVKPSTMAYWRDYSVPVLLVLANTASRRAYWALVRARLVSSCGKLHKALVPRTQQLDADAALPIRAIATTAPVALSQQLELHANLSAAEEAARASKER